MELYKKIIFIGIIGAILLYPFELGLIHFFNLKQSLIYTVYFNRQLSYFWLDSIFKYPLIIFCSLIILGILVKLKPNWFYKKVEKI